MIRLVQFRIVSLGVGLVDEGGGGVVGGGHVDDDFTVIWTAHQVLHRVDQAEVTPVLAQNGKAGVGGAVLVGGVGSDEALDQIEILVQGGGHHVVVPRDDLLLDEEHGPLGSF